MLRTEKLCECFLKQQVRYFTSKSQPDLRLPKSIQVRPHSNNVQEVIIVHVISVDAQIYIHTNGRGKRKAILGPAGHVFCVLLAGKNSTLHTWE